MKTIDEMIAVMTAFKEGKKIECVQKGSGFDPYLYVEEPCWDWPNYDYRVKPESKYRPYKDAEECFADVKKHGGWIRAKHLDEYFNVGAVTSLGFAIMVASGDKNSMNGNVAESFEELLENNVWADDGTPCGILEE